MNSFEPSGTSRSSTHHPRPSLEQGAASPFAALGLLPAIVRATADERYSEPTPVQREVIPAAVTGRDVLACAQTGTGKTAAFVLPILHQLASGPRSQGLRVLILTPTRELAAQIAERVAAYGRYLRFRHAVIYGGVSQFRQETALRQQPELLIATPGRLLDLMGQGIVKLDQVAHFVLDEADRMLDMGFIHDVKRVIGALPKTRQTLFFSATVPRPIESLAASLLVDPVRVSVTPKITTAETVEQAVVFVAKDQKSVLLEQLLGKSEVERAIVFTRTKHGADRLSRRLERVGIDAPAIHGNKSQNARERALAGFRSGKTRVLVATDIAARGIDVDGVSHVFNFDLPNVPESYVHRIGRTGRAGASGRAISFCDREERPLLVDIERFLRMRLPVLDMPLPSAAPGDAPQATSAVPAERSAPHHASPRSAEHGQRDAHPRAGEGQRQAHSRGGDHGARHGQPQHGQGPRQAQPRQGGHGGQHARGEQPRQGASHADGGAQRPADAAGTRSEDFARTRDGAPRGGKLPWWRRHRPARRGGGSPQN